MKTKTFQNGPSKAETRANQTTVAATEIIAKERTERAQKTSHLRLARLEREAEE